MEQSAGDVQAQTLERLEGALQSRCDLKGIVVLAGAQAQTGDDVAPAFTNREQVAGLGFLLVLAFLRP